MWQATGDAYDVDSIMQYKGFDKGFRISDI